MSGVVYSLRDILRNEERFLVKPIPKRFSNTTPLKKKMRREKKK